MKELVYTSARSGLRPGTTGFCTVAMADGLAAAVVEFLERLSNTYRPLYMPFDPRAADNPVAVSVLRARVGGQAVVVLSRNAAAGTDHTGRTNNLAHHLVFEGAGPSDGTNLAAVAARPGTFLTRWDDEPRRLPARPLAALPGPRGPCRAWEELTGDAGWAATVAAAWAARDPRPLYLIYPAGTDVLALLAEAVSLLPADRRWEATFTTYYTGLPPEVTCVIRGVPAGSPQEAEARRGDHVDLTDIGGPAPDGPLADLARGHQVVAEYAPPLMSEVVVPDRRPAASPPVPRPRPAAVTQPAPARPAHPEPVRTFEPVALGPAPPARGGLGTVALWGWAVFSTGIAVVLGIGWAASGKDTGPTEAGPAVAQQTSTTTTGTTRTEPTRPEGPPKDGPPSGRVTDDSKGLQADLRALLAKEKQRADTAEREREIQRLTAVAERIRAETAEDESLNVRTALEAEKALSKARARGASLEEWLHTLNSLPAAEKLVSKWRLFVETKNNQAEREKLKSSILVGQAELEEKTIPADRSKKADGDRRVWQIKVRTQGRQFLPKDSGESLTLIGWYVSALEGEVPTYVPAAGEKVHAMTVKVQYFADPDSADPEKKNGFLYVDPADLPPEGAEPKKRVFVLTDSKKPAEGYLVWVKKKG